MGYRMRGVVAEKEAWHKCCNWLPHLAVVNPNYAHKAQATDSADRHNDNDNKTANITTATPTTTARRRARTTATTTTTSSRGNYNVR